MTAIWGDWRKRGRAIHRIPTVILLKSKGIGLPSTGFTYPLSKVQVVWHLREVRSGRKEGRNKRMG